jgi:YidC/Oxa1 family membrane protein insertase
MEKRSLLAVALSAVVFIIYYSFFFKPPAPPPSPQIETQPSSSAAASKIPLETLPEAAADFPLSVKPENLPPSKVSKIDNPLYQAEASNLGGVIRSWVVKGYRETPDKNSPQIDLFSGVADRSLLLKFQEANFTLPSVIPFEVTQEGNTFVEYRFETPEFRLTKRIEWAPDNYSADVRVTLENRSSQVLSTALGLHMETLQHPEKKQGFGFFKAQPNLKYPVLYGQQGVVHHKDLRKLPPQSEERGAFEWVGLEDRYFLWAILSQALSMDNRVAYGVRNGNLLYADFSYPKEVIAPGETLKKDFIVYIGPKEIDRLKGMGVHLEKAVDYGFFSIVAHPILFLLKFFHKWVGNWGVAIILLTVFIKLILHPVNKKTLESMKGMQKIQPKLAEIREKYKDDRERMNVEMMSLFRTHKVNPMGGCLPMLLQMPVYIALYQVLYNAIELYHAPFFGFYKDLSAPDPYFVSPILLGIFMVVQQKMTPSATQDPAQANMMLLMPVIFSTFMLFLPSGLVIYIFVNTLMTVVQQYMHQHEMSLADLLRRGKKT